MVPNFNRKKGRETLKNFLYCVVQEKGFLPEYGEFMTFGVQIYSSEKGNGECITEFHDMSADADWIADLVDICNRCQVYPEHFLDVWEDFL